MVDLAAGGGRDGDLSVPSTALAQSTTASPPALPSTPKACSARRSSAIRADNSCESGSPRPRRPSTRRSPPSASAKGFAQPAGAGHPRSPGNADRRDALPGRVAAGPLRVLLSRQQGHRVGRTGRRLGARSGRPHRGITSGRPVVQLQDVVVALRAFPSGGNATPLIGCSIDPTQEGLAAMQQFLRSNRLERPPTSRSR